MKKITALLLCLALFTVLAGCGKADTAKETTSTNDDASGGAITVLSCEEMAAELGLKSIAIDDAENTVRIEGEPAVYSMETKHGGILYNIRIADASAGTDAVSSSVTLDKSRESAIFDSANADEAPSVSVERDGEYGRAYGEWNGYVFCVTFEGDRAVSDIYSTALFGFIIPLLSQDNIL